MCSYVALNVFYDANHKSAQKYGLHENPKILKIDVLRVFSTKKTCFLHLKAPSAPITVQAPILVSQCITWALLMENFDCSGNKTSRNA